MSKKIDIIGILFSDITRKGFEEKIESSLNKGEFISIFTPNPEIAVKAYGLTELSQTINSASLVLPDGIGIVIASRILKTPIKERVTGIDTGEFILSLANKKKLKVYLLGGKKGVIENAAWNISKKYPCLKVCGYHHGYFDRSGKENEQLIRDINTSSPDIIFVCLGFPDQELWISKNCANIPSLKISAALGGSIDVWANNVKRAPKLWQKLGIEWLWRVICSPSRIKRLKYIPIFLKLVINQRSCNRKNNKKSSYIM